MSASESIQGVERQGTRQEPVSCAHCDLPVRGRVVGEGPHFCCTGCKLVYNALRQSGIQDTFYRLRELDEHDQQPADPSISEHALSELDTDAFLEEHTEVVEEGVRAVELFLDGVHCAACVWLVERQPQVLEGVVEARLDLPRARLHLKWRPEEATLSEIARRLARFGYRAQPVRRDQNTQRTDEERSLLVKVGVCWALAGNVMLLAFAFYAGVDLVSEPGLASAARYLSLGLAIPSMIVGGGVFFRRAAASLRMALQMRSLRSLHMDTPIALGLLIGFADSTWATLTGNGDVWFDSITVLIAALLTARWLQLRSRRLAGDAGERLLSLIPSMARRLPETGDAAEWVRAEDLEPGDRVLVPAGEVFPVDGLVVEGRSRINNAVLTGESRPEDAAQGTRVAAGATNVKAPLTIQVTAAGDQTRVGELLSWVRDASARRAPVVLLADRLGGYFVLAALTLALVTAAVWYAIDPSQVTTHVVALLVITCPCALGMATPLAMAVASGRAARAGTFIKSDEATQLLTQVDTVVLDKTGTLTEGRLTLVGEQGDAEAVELAAALETASNHPVAAALLRARPQHGALGVEEVDVVNGEGIRGRVAGKRVAVGRPEWIAQQAAALPESMRDALDGYARAGHTPVAVAVEGQARAALAFDDGLRADARETVTELLASGKELYLLSGDHPEVVDRIASELGLARDHAHGDVEPERKRAIVEELEREGRTVAMVGDGVNDAAALQAASVGVAVEGGSTAGLVAADVFLTEPGLRPILRLFEGAGGVMRVIRRNLAFSLLYNIVGAAVAMIGLVTPLVAAVAMPISSLVVVVSSILHRSFRSASRPAEHEIPRRLHTNRRAA